MASRNVYKRLGYRIAEEIQLIAEEKWIIEALNKIKKQRNSLQIERLQLESLKAQLNSNTTTDAESRKKSNDEIPVISTIDLMQNSHSGTIDNKPLAHPNNNEVLCNTEELDLLVTVPVFNRSPVLDNNIEEDESDEEDDNVFIDINMLMNGIESEENLE